MFDLAWKHAGPVVEDAKKQAKPILGKEDLISIDKKKIRGPKTQFGTRNVPTSCDFLYQKRKSFSGDYEIKMINLDTYIIFVFRVATRVLIDSYFKNKEGLKQDTFYKAVHYTIYVKSVSLSRH